MKSFIQLCKQLARITLIAFTPLSEKVILNHKNPLLHGLEIRLSDWKLRLMDAHFAIVLLKSKDSIIYVSSDFFDLSPEAQEFILLHELGHIKHHIGKLSLHIAEQRTQCLMEGTVHFTEYEADKFALQNMDPINGLKAMIEVSNKLFDKIGDHPCADELVLRTRMMGIFVHNPTSHVLPGNFINELA